MEQSQKVNILMFNSVFGPLPDVKIFFIAYSESHFHSDTLNGKIKKFSYRTDDKIKLEIGPFLRFISFVENV